MENILVIGAGQLGSRHLQSIRNVSKPLRIFVLDPSEKSLEVAKQRYGDKAPGAAHEIYFGSKFSEISEKEFASCVIATNSDVRFQVFKSALENLEIKSALLEKILFVTREDYGRSRELAKSAGCATYVNLCMRMQSAYYELKNQLKGEPFHYRVSGSNYGLITNAIHYLDHAVFLDGSNEFVTDTSKLNRNLIPSKRPGFQEINGEINFQFKSGSSCSLASYDDGAAPVLIEVMSKSLRFVSRENENKYWLSCAENKWVWEERELGFMYQSQLTERFLSQIFQGEEPALPTLDDSCATHLGLLGPLSEYIRGDLGIHSDKEFPFT